MILGCIALWAETYLLSEADYLSRKDVCLRGDPLFISPVMAFATEYENDIGWAGKRLLDSFSPRLRVLWRLCEMASVFGTMALAFLEVYFIMNGVFLSIGVAAIVAWTIWLLGSSLFWERCFERDSATSFMGHPRSSEPLAHPIQA